MTTTMPATDLSELLDAYPSLGHLPTALRELLALNVQRMEAPVGAVLFDVNAPCSHFILVTDGRLRVFRPGVERDIFLYTVERGQSCVLTVSCLLGNNRYPARGVADKAMVGYALPQPIFNELLDRSPDFRRMIFNLFGDRLAGLVTLVEDVALRHLDQRLAGLLAARSSPVNATHQQIANELGSVREVVSRILKRFERRGWVRLERRAVFITDRESLVQFSTLGD